jgi:hypothetical protein
MNSAPPPQGEGFTNSQEDGIINPSEREEVVIVPLYGLIHDSPAITAIQKATRRGRRAASANDFVEETQWIDAMIVPFLEKIMAKVRKLEEEKK